MEDAEIGGEPGTNTDSSVMIGVQVNQGLITEEDLIGIDWQGVDQVDFGRFQLIDYDEEFVPEDPENKEYEYEQYAKNVRIDEIRYNEEAVQGLRVGL